MNRNFETIYKLRLLLLLLCLAGTATVASAQTNAEIYGQNRVQLRTYNWRFFDTEHFRVYNYDAAGRQLARYVAEQAEKDIDIIEKKMNGQFPHRFNIILYNNYDEYRQTNVGRKYDSQLQDIPAGTVDLVGDRLVVYFTGVHTDLRAQLRAGMSRVVMQRLIFGESFREMVKNAVLLNLPAWTTDGFIAYIVDGWDTETENTWKNMLLANPKAGFYDLAEKDPATAGKAFWKYVSMKYGESNVKNLLYTMQLKSSLTQGIKITLGQTVKQAYDSVISFYNGVYALDAAQHDAPDSISKAILEIPVPKDNTVIKDIRVSPRGYDAAYVAWKNGEYQVYIQHTTGEKVRNMVLEGGLMNHNEGVSDPDYPLMAWSNDGYKLAIMYKRGAQTRLRIYNAAKAKIQNYVIPRSRFDRVLGMTFTEDDQQLVFSAIKKSQTDLYLFTLRGSRMVNITNDLWDDVQPTFVSGGSRRGVLFLSNRPVANLNAPIAVNELPVGPMNVFFYDTKTQRRELLRCSDMKTGMVSQPIQFGPDHFAFLYDSSGIRNQYVVLFNRDVNNMDSAYSVPVTNFAQSILAHQYNPASNSVAQVVQVGGQYKIYFNPLRIPDPSDPIKTVASATLTIQDKSKPLTERGGNKQPTGKEPAESFLSGGNIFQSEFDDTTGASAPMEPEIIDPIVTSEPIIDSILVDSTYVKMKAQPYRLSFKPDFFSVKVDNTMLFNKYQPVAYNGGQYVQPNLGGMLTVSLNDAMENHRFTGGFRLPIDLSGMAYFLQYENFTRRIDWGILYLRTENLQGYNVNYVDNQGNVVLINPQLGKVTSNILQGAVTYPFDRVRSARFNLGLRQDVLNWKSTDTLSLSLSPRDRMYWAMSRAEYVYDNTSSPMLNIRKGTRYKFYAEYLYKLSNPNGGFYNLGFDLRNYLKIYKNIILASRGAYAHSGGNQKINYIMGGVDNWIFAKQGSLPPTQTENYAFQSLVTNLRGYEQNARSGNTYGIINVEVRAPVFSTFLKKPIQSGFLRNLQLVGFIDAGGAWNGWLPTADNTSRSYSFYNPQSGVGLSASISQQDLAIGYGAGVRTMLFGYFMRLDAGWNTEGRQKPLLHFSIGTDF